MPRPRRKLDRSTILRLLEPLPYVSRAQQAKALGVSLSYLTKEIEKVREEEK